MRELAIMLALLARSWRLLGRVDTVPASEFDEFKALKAALTDFFTDPVTVLGLMTVAPMAQDGPDGIDVSPLAPEPVQQAVEAVVCPICGGTGKSFTRYIGVSSDKCSVCNGAKKVFVGAQGVMIPAWGADGVDWYAKDQRHIWGNEPPTRDVLATWSMKIG